MRYSIIITDHADKIKISFTDYENPATEAFTFACADNEIAQIINAAKFSFAQNSIDILQDCSSRERAGWLCDSYFSSMSEKFLTGENLAEKTLLDNYANILDEDKNLPKHMLPMNYPSDVVNKDFIPNWALWYILEVIKYAKTYPNDDLISLSKEKILNVLSYFSKKENEFGLLENLDGWIFVEWSNANAPNRVCGVNIPTNICYMSCLKKVGEYFNIEKYKIAADKLKNHIIDFAYDGEFFVDNLIRNEQNKLVRTSNYSEVCQYHAFWFELISKNDYPMLYDKIINNSFNTNKQLCSSALFFGIYLRLDLLMQANKRTELILECKKQFSHMAKATGTLWEHLDTRASCCHAFPSYAIRWIVFALTGFDTLTNKSTSNNGIGIDCEFKIPVGTNNFIIVTVKENLVTIKQD